MCLCVLYFHIQIALNYTLELYADNVTDAVLECARTINVAFLDMHAYSALQPIYRIQPVGQNEVKVVQDSVAALLAGWYCSEGKRVTIDPLTGDAYCGKYEHFSESTC